MRYFFVTYCFGSREGQALIGVYKRGLRVAIEPSRRGHEIVFFCTGRDAYHDELTALAETQLEFIDIPFTVAACEEAEENRQRFLQKIRQIDPDMIVVGEAPLAGSMLEATRCGVELGIPVVFLDNAYSPAFVDQFHATMGPMADAIILTGPSSHHTSTPPNYLCQVPPFIESWPQAARALVKTGLALAGKKLITVLAYDCKVEQLGFSLVQRLCEQDVEILFLAREPEHCHARLATAPKELQARARVIVPPADPVMFGLLEISHLAVVKYGFMQVSECLALQTPVIVVYHEGPTWLDALPNTSRQFAHVTARSEADSATVASARRFLNLSLRDLATVHNGAFQAAVKAADFLETVRRSPRRHTAVESARLGFRIDHLQAAFMSRFPRAALNIQNWRSCRLRLTLGYDLYSLVVWLTVDGEARVERLWARIYKSDVAARADQAAASRRHLLYYSASDRLLFEDDLGEAELPELNP